MVGEDDGASEGDGWQQRASVRVSMIVIEIGDVKAKVVMIVTEIEIEPAEAHSDFDNDTGYFPARSYHWYSHTLVRGS